MNIHRDPLDDDLSSAMGTEALLDHDLGQRDYPPPAKSLRNSRFTIF